MISLVDVASVVVLPAVRAVFREGEVSAIQVIVDEARGGSVSLSLTAGGETFHDLAVQGDVEGQSHDDWRERLRSNLVDFIAESRLGWGQNRDVRCDSMDVDLFAGVAVSDFDRGVAWFERLFGEPATFAAHETELVWTVAEHRSIYVLLSPDPPMVMAVIEGPGLAGGERSWVCWFAGPRCPGGPRWSSGCAVVAAG